MCATCVRIIMESVDVHVAMRPVPTKANIAADTAAILEDLADAPTLIRKMTEKELATWSPLWWRDYACRDEVMEAVTGRPLHLLDDDMHMHMSESFGLALFYREVARGLRNLHVLISPN